MESLPVAQQQLDDALARLDPPVELHRVVHGRRRRGKHFVDRAAPLRSTLRRREPIAGSQTNELNEMLAAAPQQLTELIRPQPVFADGKQLGYRVYPGRNRQQFTKLGLKPGDLVTQINGAALDDPARGLEIFRALEEGSQVSVTVERDGQPQVLVLDSATLNSLETATDQ